MEKVLEELKPPLDKDKLAEHLLPWLNDLRLSQNAIDTILSFSPRNTMVDKLRFATVIVVLISELHLKLFCLGKSGSLFKHCSCSWSMYY